MLRSGSIRIPGALMFFASEETRPEVSPGGNLYLVPRESMLDSTPLGVLGQSQDKLQRREVMLCSVVACYTAVGGELFLVTRSERLGRELIMYSVSCRFALRSRLKINDKILYRQKSLHFIISNW